MIDPEVSNASPVAVAVARRLDQVCDRFEAAWKAAASTDQRPRIEDYLRESPDTERAALLDELILLDAEYRHRAGENPQPDDYQERFPNIDPTLLNRAVRPASSPQRRLGLPRGSRLGPYEVLGPLGAGGMGEVYRARDSRLDREVAIKVLPAPFARDRQRVTRFEREAKAVASLSHPSILAVHDCGKEQELFFIVTELLDGETLRSRLARGALAWRKVVDIGAAVAEGLMAAHAKGIIHRDLKPENIFLTAEGRVKILDFGLARLEAPAPADAATDPYHAVQTELGAVLGTAGYMSPEQVRGQTADARSDIFSLGCVLYEMLTGRRAFDRPTAGEKLAAILRDVPPRLCQSAKEVPEALDRVITRCLDKNPQTRFQSAQDLASALREVLESGRRRPGLRALGK